MPTVTDLAAMTILAAGIAATDIARVAQQLVPTDILPVQQLAVLAQRPHEQWASAPQQPDPDIEAGRR
jgi:hypothetical protein